MQPTHAPVIIVGSGPAGCTAAIYAARALLKPIMICGLQPGGQLTITTDVENYPGFMNAVQGPDLMQKMLAHAEHVGAEIHYDIVTKVALDRRPFRIETDSGRTYTADCVIVATGAQARWLGLPSEETYKGFGVSACATCDGFFYRGKDVAVIGGGNSAVEEALYLSHLAKSVTVIHRRDAFRAERVLRERLAAKENVRILWNSTVEEVTGEVDANGMRSANGIDIRDIVTGERTHLSLDGIFVAIGHSPAVDLFAGQLQQKPNGYLWTEPGRTQTNIPGVFAAGDVADDVYRQAVTAAGLGCMAALEAERYVSSLEATPQAA